VLRPHRIAIGLYDYEGGRGLARRHRVEADIVGERTELPELTGHRRPDLVLVNDDDLSYAKTRLDSYSMRFLLGNIGEFADPLPAALCWAAAWDMCRDAELAARHYVGLVNEGVDSVTEISVLQTLLRQASAAVRRYADPAWRDEGLAQMPSQAPIGSLPTCTPSPAWPPGRRISRSSPGCSTGPPGWMASRWTPSCAGACCSGWSAGGLPGRTR
jgi:aminopeptidase N